MTNVMAVGARCLAPTMLLLFFASPAHATITVRFFSNELGTFYPHAFILIDGTTATGQPKYASFGFTAITVSPAVLFGPVPGDVEPIPKRQVRIGGEQFSLNVNVAQ